MEGQGAKDEGAKKSTGIWKVKKYFATSLHDDETTARAFMPQSSCVPVPVYLVADLKPDARDGRCGCVWSGDSLATVCFTHLQAVRAFDAPQRPAPAQGVLIPRETAVTALRMFDRLADDPLGIFANRKCHADAIRDALAQRRQVDDGKASRECEQLRADAARYRALRTRGIGFELDPRNEGIVFSLPVNDSSLSPESIDAAIDAAMKDAP